jgi:hypothetical protein
MILSHLKDKLNARKEENFIPVLVRELLSSLEEDGSYSKNQFLNVSHDFYSTALQYLNAWGVYFDYIYHVECMLLKTVIAIDENSLFDEISSLKSFVTKDKIRNGT